MPKKVNPSANGNTSRWQIQLKRQPEKVLRRIPKTLLRRIQAAIDALAIDPHPPGVKKLVGTDELYRIRVGDWRISYAILDDILVILVVEISPRGQAYRNL